MWGLITGGITTLFSGWMKDRSETKKAKHNLAIATIDAKANWEATAAGGMRDSWKDEWFTVIFSLPLIGILFSPFIDMAISLWQGYDYIEGSLLATSLESLQGLDGAPDWYTTILGVMVGASFGVKSITKGLKAYNSN